MVLQHDLYGRFLRLSCLSFFRAKGLDPLQGGFVLALTQLCIWRCNLCREALRQPGKKESDHPWPRAVHPLHFLHSLSSQPLLHRGGLFDGCGHRVCGSLGEAFIGDVSEEDDLALNLGIAGSTKNWER